MVDSLRFWFVFLCIAGAVMLVGWKQPLRYRFMSAQAIYELEHPAPPPPPIAPTKEQWMLDPRRKTLLDRDTYNSNGYRGGTRTTSQSGVPYTR